MSERKIPSAMVDRQILPRQTKRTDMGIGLSERDAMVLRFLTCEMVLSLIKIFKAKLRQICREPSRYYNKYISSLGHVGVGLEIFEA